MDTPWSATRGVHYRSRERRSQARVLQRAGMRAIRVDVGPPYPRDHRTTHKTKEVPPPHVRPMLMETASAQTNNRERPAERAANARFGSSAVFRANKDVVCFSPLCGHGESLALGLQVG